MIPEQLGFFPRDSILLLINFYCLVVDPCFAAVLLVVPGPVRLCD